VPERAKTIATSEAIYATSPTGRLNRKGTAAYRTFMHRETLHDMLFAVLVTSVLMAPIFVTAYFTRWINGAFDRTPETGTARELPRNVLHHFE
jgi:hypothetical protein